MDNILPYARAILTTTPERWTRLAETLPADLLQRKPAPGEWSAVECLRHMIETERVFQERLRCFLEQRDLPNITPGTQAEMAATSAELIAEFVDLRRQSLQTVSAITDADLERSVRHTRLGPVTLRQMMHQWAAHDLSHTVQAEEAMMQPLIEGCGPWAQFFSAHVVNG